MFLNKSTTKNNKQASDDWEGQEVIKWLDTEGYDEIRQVNTGLRWPSVWGKRGKIIKSSEPQSVAPATSSVQKTNKARSRQIKQQSGGLPLGSAQVSASIFQAKEERRRQTQATRQTNQAVPRAIRQPTNRAVPTTPPVPPPSVAQPTPPAPTTNNDQPSTQPADIPPLPKQKDWKRPKLTEINLAHGQTTFYFNWNKFWLALTQWLVVTLFFLSLCGSLLYLWQQRKSKQATDVTQRFAKINQLIDNKNENVSI